MSINDKKLDMYIKEHITLELQEIQVPSVDEEWLKFKNLVNNEKKGRRIIPSS